MKSEKELKKQSAKDVKNLRLEHEKAIAKSFTDMTNEEMTEAIASSNIEAEIEKQASKSNFVWKQEKTYINGIRNKGLVRKLRDEQTEKVNLVNSAIEIKDTEKIKNACLLLFKFSTENLVDIKSYSNKSYEAKNSNRKDLDKAYNKLFEFIK